MDAWIEVWEVDNLGLFTRIVGVGWLHDVHWPSVELRGLVVIDSITREEITA